MDLHSEHAAIASEIEGFRAHSNPLLFLTPLSFAGNLWRRCRSILERKIIRFYDDSVRRHFKVRILV